MSRRLASVVCLLLGLVVLYGAVGLLLGLLFGQPLAGLVFGVAIGVLASLPVLLLMGADLLERAAPRPVTLAVRDVIAYPEEAALGRAGRQADDRPPGQRSNRVQLNALDADAAHAENACRCWAALPRRSARK